MITTRLEKLIDDLGSGKQAARPRREIPNCPIAP
jgi:hypothetical protein